MIQTFSYPLELIKATQVEMSIVDPELVSNLHQQKQSHKEQSSQKSGDSVNNLISEEIIQ